MKVDSLRLYGFRNYLDEEAVFVPGINIISGDNAQGKTNLLEAVFLLTGSKSFRSRFDRELVGFNAVESKIEAQIESSGRQQKLEITLRKGKTRSFRQNGVRKTAAELSGEFTAVLFCPDDLNLIRDGPAARRRFIDTAASQLKPGYAAALNEFNRLYEHKTRILRNWREKPSLLETLDDFSEGLAKYSAVLIRYRAAFARRISESASLIHRDFSGGEELSVIYRTANAVTNPLAPHSEIALQLIERQRELKKAEIDAGICLIGAHKDDLDIEINGITARSFASQGQARTAALSLKLSEREIFFNETGQWPVLLLDDVLSELDSKRRGFVLNRIDGGQTMITCCEDEDILRKASGKAIRISEGKICTCT